MNLRSHSARAAGLSAAAIFAFNFAPGQPVRAQHQPANAPAPASLALPADIQVRLAKLQSDLQTAQAASDARAQAAALNGMGSVYFNLSEIDRALDRYTQAATQARAAKDAPQGAAALNGMAACYAAQKQFDKAAQTYTQAFNLTKASGDVLGMATALEGAGQLSGSAGSWQTALTFHQRALTLARRAGDQDLEATVLLNLAVAQANLGSVPDAKQNAQQAIQIYHQVGDKEGEANVDATLAIGYSSLHQLDTALDLGNKALALYRESGDRTKQAAELRGMGLGYMALGQPPKALDCFNQALEISRRSQNHSDEALALNGVGSVYLYTGEKQKLLETYNQSLAIARSIGNEEEEAHALNLVGSAYNTFGDRQKALDYYNQALPLFKHQGDIDGQANMYNNLGMVYGAMGQGQKALEFYNQAAPLYLQVHDDHGGALSLNNIGTVYLALGDKEKALDNFTRALPLFRDSSDQYATVTALTNIGFTYVKMSQWQNALDNLNQALTVEDAIGDRPHKALTLTIMGFAYSGLGENQKALDALNQALPIAHDTGRADAEALTLDKMGAVYNDLGQTAKAQDSLKQALATATEIGNPLLQSMILNDLMLSLQKSQPSVAIFYGKLGINLLQQLRGNIQGLDKELQAGFLLSKEDFYHGLADLLIAQGRLPEAQQVLNLLKEQEYSDYTRGAAADSMSPLPLTPAEQQAENDYQKSTSQIVALSTEWADLRKNTQRTPEQEARFKQVSDQMKAANAGFLAYYNRLYVLFGSAGNANKQLDFVKGSVDSLTNVLARMPHTVALYTVVGKDRTSIIVITATTRVAREYVIPEAELNKKIAAFEQVLRSRSSDPHPAAEDLYNILIAPVKSDLDQAQAQTLVWSLDGALRYVPMAALYDGHHYLVEQYNTVTITPVSIANLMDKPDVSNMNALAMGISRQYEQALPPLPAVAGELDEIVKDSQVKGADGVMPGTVLLNGAFTEKAMEDQLGAQHTVVHIASHFVFQPGDESQSYLLLAGDDKSGTGYHLTVADFHTNPNLTLNATDLLTLSACETGMTGTASNGREVDGLGTTALDKGAKAVISTLWEVNDASTGILMADFYKRWADGGGKVSKVEALRQAQLDLLQGKVTPQSASTGRGIIADSDSPSAPTASTGYTHPYYWAPFVLMGNWR